MFFEGDRIDAMREMILAETLEARKAALAKLLPYQRDDFAGIFRALKGYPATIRFLDPPLHEFLPHTRGAADGPGEEARRAGRARFTRACEQLHEFNPMLGFRGCRLGIGYPEISAMQARAVFEAAAIVQKEGIKVRPEIMIPLVGFKKELDLQLEVVHQAARDGAGRAEGEAQLHGRHDDRDAARRADRRRDRAVGRVLQLRHQRPDADRRSGCRATTRARSCATYAELEIMKKNPFATIDQTGVGQLVEIAVAKGRQDQAGHQARHLRRARRRSGVDSLLRARSGSTT